MIDQAASQISDVGACAGIVLVNNKLMIFNGIDLLLAVNDSFNVNRW